MSARVALAFRDVSKIAPYRRALAECGLDPVSFMPGAPGSLDEVHGLVLTGGSDVAPAIYRAEPEPECGPADPERDAYESSLLREALARDLPVLAICRGMQLFNVVRGGTLIQHLPNTGKHRQSTGGAAVHEVVLDGPLASICRASRLPVNSRHHQAVDRLGEGLAIAARDAEDGLIEGFVLPGAKFAVAVQWHPEDMVEKYPPQRALFAAFAASVP